MIRINAKSAPEEIQLMARLKSGFKNIEIQLINKEIAKEEYDITKKMIEEGKIDISVVHTPLVQTDTGKIEISLNQILKDSYYKMLCDTVEYAEFISNIENKRIKVVIHERYSKEIWMENNFLVEKIGPKLKAILNKNPHVDLVLENISAFDGDRFRTVFYMSDVAYTVSVLNKIIPNRIYTLMDTCHMMMSIEAYLRITNGIKITNWDEQFKQANDGVKMNMMHLNNIHDNGLGDDHGVPFYSNDENDLKKLSEIMQAYEKYTDCEITVEVREDSYTGPLYNAIETVKSLKKLGYEVEI